MDQNDITSIVKELFGVTLRAFQVPPTLHSGSAISGYVLLHHLTAFQLPSHHVLVQITDFNVA